MIAPAIEFPLGFNVAHTSLPARNTIEIARTKQITPKNFFMVFLRKNKILKKQKIWICAILQYK